MLKLSKQQLHQRPTYESLVKDTILNPKDKINLPNRQATLLRMTQKLQMFDDESFLDLDDENKQMVAMRMQQMHLHAMVSNKQDTELKTEKVQQQESKPPVIIDSPKKQQQPKHNLSSSSAQEPTTTQISSSSAKEPIHLPPSTEQSDDELQKHYQDFIDFRNSQTQQQKSSAKNLVNKNLESASDTSNKPYVHKLADLQMKKHAKPMDTSTDPSMDTSTSTVEKRVASPIKNPSKKAHLTKQLELSDPEPELTSSKPASKAKKTIEKVKTTSYTEPESSAKIPTKSRINIQVAYEILTDAVNKNVIIGADAIEIKEIIKSQLKSDSKTKKTGADSVKKKLATARLKELYAKYYDKLKKHHSSK